MDLFEAFHLPIISLTDQAGMQIGTAGEKQATIRRGARAITAVYQAIVPCAEVIIRRVFGVGGAGMTNRHSFVRRWAWPSGDRCPSRAVSKPRKELEASDDPESRLAEIRQRLESVRSPLRTTHKFGVEDIVDPRQTRVLLYRWVHDAWSCPAPSADQPSG